MTQGFHAVTTHILVPDQVPVVQKHDHIAETYLIAVLFLPFGVHRLMKIRNSADNNEQTVHRQKHRVIARPVEDCTPLNDDGSRQWSSRKSDVIDRSLH